MSFDDFWTRYPRKIEKPLARAAYAKALKIASHETIMAGLERYISAEPWHGDKRYCIYPERWLKRERWEDEYEDDNPLKDMTFEERRRWSREHAPKLDIKPTARLRSVK